MRMAAVSANNAQAQAAPRAKINASAAQGKPKVRPSPAYPQKRESANRASPAQLVIPETVERVAGQESFDHDVG